MSIDLNELGNGGNSAIFNGGIAGKVEGVKITIEKKSDDDTSNQPDYKVFATDASGSSVNQGFYYPAENADGSALNQLIGRAVSIAKALAPADFQFQSTEGKSSKEILDYVMSVAKQHENNTLANVFCTYGTTSRPGKYLQLRYFNFIEKPGTERSVLTRRNNDQMERVDPTDISNNTATDNGLGTSPQPQNNIPGWPGM